MASEPATQHVRLDPAFITDFQDDVLGWYADHARRLPWRETTDPYRIMVSELMLQQTQVDRVIPKYHNFIDRFPTLEALAAAPLSDVLVAWSGLGYNRRAKYLWDTARLLTQDDSGGAALPSSVAELMTLPGVGPYTARAVAVFAWNEDEVLLETNTRRIYQLLWTGEEQSEAELTALAHELLPRGRSRDWHHALMDLGTLAAKNRSAEAQQRLLVETFPLLGELELPPFATDQVARPRQSSFEGSRRQIRGAVLRRLGAGFATEAELQAALDDERLGEVLHDLEREGFIIRDDAAIRLR